MKKDFLLIEEIENRFPEGSMINIRQLHEMYMRFDPFLNDSTIKSRVTRLIKTGVLQRVGRGMYMLGNEVIYIPPISRKTKQIYGYSKKAFPLLEICLWHTSALNHFMVHQPAKFSLIVEVERDGEESLFYHLKEKFRNVYLNPSEEVYFNYIIEKRDSIIVKSLIPEAPVQELYKTKVPRLEKILVDIYCDQLIYYAQQGEEMDNTWMHALETYTINHSTLLRYADRRGRRNEIRQYLQSVSKLLT